METNPRLRAAFLETVENQLEADDPPETRLTLERLIEEGLSEEDAKTCIAQAVCVEIYFMLKHQKTLNRERYLRNLARLPEEPEE